MSYASLKQKIRLIPEKYLDEVSDFVEFLLIKTKTANDESPATDFSKFFGALKLDKDGMDIQRSLRDEWY